MPKYKLTVIQYELHKTYGAVMDINDLQIPSNAENLEESKDRLTKASNALSSIFQGELLRKNQWSAEMMTNQHKTQTDIAHRQLIKDNPVIKISECLEKQVRQIESKLNTDEEIMVMAASFGSQITFYVDSIEFSNPNIIIFHGTTESGKPTRLIQHYTQLNFLLQVAERHNPDEKRKPIGFIQN